MVFLEREDFLEVKAKKVEEEILGPPGHKDLLENKVKEACRVLVAQ